MANTGVNTGLGTTGPSGCNGPLGTQCSCTGEPGPPGPPGALPPQPKVKVSRPRAIPFIGSKVTLKRNDKCPCNSGKKAKRCCLPTIKLLASLPVQVRQQVIVNRILG